MKRRIQQHCRRVLLTTLGATLSMGAMASAFSAERLGESLAAPDAEIEVFVRLDTASVAELNIQSVQSTGELASSADQRAQAARVDAQQAGFRQLLAGLDVTELSSLRMGANGLRVRVPLSQVNALRGLPGVVSVARVELHTPDNIESVPSIGAPDLWTGLNVRGQGVSIGVIDTGIDYLHANLGGAGNPADYAANNKNEIEPGTFPTAKVVGGFDFAGPTYSASAGAADPTPDPDPDPLDGNGHGSHVAGSAAGVGVPGSIGAGVAPDAKLYALKVFGDVAGSTNLTSDAIEWALDPNGDGDMSDHLDVINMSLGSPFGEPADPSAIASQNAAELGIIVVTSAGNEAAVPYITGAPGVAPAAISTAAITPSGRRYGRITVNAPASIAGVKTSAEGAGPVQFKNIPPISGTLVEAVPLNGCVTAPATLTNAAAINGNIALIQRGTCNFIVKYLAAQAAGARAIVVFNSVAGAPIVMGGLNNTVTIPGLMVSLADGNAINAQATTDAGSPVQITLDAVTDPSRDDQIAGFSSRGPGHGGSLFKPDVAAPGVAIVSTGVGTGTGPGNLQGTSMSAPHTAGSAALLHQIHPDLSPVGIKALLQNSTINANASAENNLARQGTGVIRVNAAAELTSYAAPGGVSFGRLNPLTPSNKSIGVEVANLSDSGRTFTVTHVPKQTYPGVSVSCPSHVTVPAHHERKTRIRLTFDPAAAFAAGEFDNASVSQREVDGWCVFSDGVDSLRVGYLAVVDAAARVTARAPNAYGIIKVQNKGPALGIAEGFTQVGEGSHTPGEPNGTFEPATFLFSNVGARTGDPEFFFGLPVIEFGVGLCNRFEHLSNLEVDVYLDTNSDGVEDVFLTARDWSSLSATGVIGTVVTAQFPIVGFNGSNPILGQGFLDWIVSGWDFNDNNAILPFTLTGGEGFVTEAFNYRMIVRARNGTEDTISGRVDLAREFVPDLNSFALEPGESVDVIVTGPSEPGNLLWLLPNNRLTEQQRSVWIEPFAD
jgi:subtilisin family serine protease